MKIWLPFLLCLLQFDVVAQPRHGPSNGNRSTHQGDHESAQTTVTTQAIEMYGIHINATRYTQKLERRLSSIIGSFERPGLLRMVAVVDYSRSIFKPRFFVFDRQSNSIVYSTYVGHSYYSGDERPHRFSNVPNTRKTSLGLYRVGKQYYGRYGRSKRLHGLSKTNSNALKRGIVVHGMPDGSPANLYSWGCLTFFERDLSDVIQWLDQSRYLIVVSA